MKDNLADRLYALMDALPPAGSVTFTRLDLQALVGLDGGDDGVLTDLTVGDVAVALDRAPGTIRSWCNSGRLPGAYRLRGREWRIPRGALEALREGDSEEPQQTDRRDYDLAAWRDECP